MNNADKWSLVADETEHLAGLWITDPQGGYIARLWTDGNGPSIPGAGMSMERAGNVGQTIVRAAAGLPL